MAEGTPAIQVLPKVPPTGDSTASYVGKTIPHFQQQQQQQALSNSNTAMMDTSNPQQYYNGNNAPSTSNYGGYNYNNNNYSSNFNNNNNNNLNNPGGMGMMADDDGSQVDSALLAALRDARERVALLRLEQVMIDFMNAPEGYLEVGGPYNSVVVSPNSNQRYSTATTVVDGTGRQTSFQRCILHRLADRFGIVREMGTILDGQSIRLIKQKDSRIPKMKLLDHVDQNSAELTGEKGGAGANGDDSQMPATATSSQPNTKEKTKRKMKIMKRQSSQDSNSNRSDKNTSTPRSRKSKNISDKEKAYAEARARIFADEANNIGSSAHGSTGGNSSLPSSSAPSPTTTPPPNSYNNNSSSNNNQSSNNSSNAAASVHRSSSNGSLNMPTRMSSSSLAGGGGGDNDNTDMPVAAQSGGVSKATWRNRQQEENDPDFQRGAGLRTMMPTAPAFVPGQTPAYFYGQAAPPVVGAYPPQPPYGYPAAQDAAAVAYGAGGRGMAPPARGFVVPPQQQQQQRIGYGYGPQVQAQQQLQQQQQQHHPYRTGTGPPGSHPASAREPNLEEFPALR